MFFRARVRARKISLRVLENIPSMRNSQFYRLAKRSATECAGILNDGPKIPLIEHGHEKEVLCKKSILNSGKKNFFLLKPGILRIGCS
jgi:hypothetical protein